jgi:hypothetical protein
LGEAKAIGDMMYQRRECIDQASVCRDKAQADPERHDYWIDEAIVWLQRAMQTPLRVTADERIPDESHDRPN